MLEILQHLPTAIRLKSNFSNKSQDTIMIWLFPNFLLHFSLFHWPFLPKATQETNAGGPAHPQLSLPINLIHSFLCSPILSDTLVRLKENRHSPGSLRYWCLMRHAEKWAHNSISKGRTAVILLQSPQQAVSLQGRECLHLCRPQQLAHTSMVYQLYTLSLSCFSHEWMNSQPFSTLLLLRQKKKSTEISKPKDKTKFVTLYMSRNRAYPQVETSLFKSILFSASLLFMYQRNINL